MLNNLGTKPLPADQQAIELSSILDLFIEAHCQITTQAPEIHQVHSQAANWTYETQQVQKLSQSVQQILQQEMQHCSIRDSKYLMRSCK